MTQETGSTPKPAETHNSRGGQQKQSSKQSMSNSTGGAAPSRGRAGASPSGSDDAPGIGSSQAQDRDTPNLERSSGGKSGARSDIERGEQDSAGESLVNDSTGAFKERP
jgi:hypothetical protein